MLNRSNIPSLIESSISYEYNIKSFFSNRNTFAAFLLVGIYLTVYRLVFIRKNLLDILIGIFVVMNLILTLSRTSIAGMLIFLLVLSVFRKRGRKFIGLVKAAAITAILILLILVTGLDGFFVDAVIRVNAGTSNRVALWITCLNILRSGRWLTGVGYGILDYFNAHNTYLSILLSGGILLGAFYLRFLIKTIKSYIYIIRSESDIGVYFAAIFLSYAAVSMAESITPFLSSAQNLIFTIIVFMIPQYYSNSIV